MQCKAFDERYKVYTFTTNVISYSYNELKKTLNKRAQRALVHSPEEKIKGQGEGIYREPLMLSTKYW